MANQIEGKLLRTLGTYTHTQKDIGLLKCQMKPRLVIIARFGKKKFKCLILDNKNFMSTKEQQVFCKPFRSIILRSLLYGRDSPLATV